MSTSMAYKALVLQADAIRIYATNLALTLGTFHGTNDFAFQKPTLWNGFVLDQFQRELTALVVRAMRESG